MHYRLYVLTNKENAKTSKEARDYVYNELSNDSSFVGDGGRWNCPISDWFVIGGRWSGALVQLLLDQNILKKFWKEFEKQQLGWTNNTDKKTEIQQKKGQKLFMKYFPKFKGEIPIWRDAGYLHKGNEDDAQIVTKELWEVLKKEYKDGIPSEPNPEDDKLCDLESNEVVKENVISKKWLVVVDYHS